MSHRLSSGSGAANGSKKRAIIAIVAVIILAAAAVFVVKYMNDQRQTEAKNSYDSGMNALQSGNVSDAVLRLKKSVDLNPDNDKAHLNLARGYTSTGKIKDAEQEYLASLKLNPNQPEAEYNLGVIYKSKRDFDEALAHFQKAKKLNKNLYAADIMIAYVYRETGKADKAIGVLNQVIKAKPFGANIGDLYVELGLSYKAKGDNDSAVLQWAQALKIDPNNAKAKALLEGK